MEFCERLEELLKEENIMQKDFLAACGLGKNSFSNWRKSKTGYPTLPVLRSISDYLGVSVEYLKGETDDRGQKNSPMPSDGTGDMLDKKISLLSETERAQIERQVDEILIKRLSGQ